MGKFEQILDLLRNGTYTIEELAKKSGLSKEEVEGILEILKSMGYLKEVEAPSCELCPLKKVCPGKCVRSGIKAYVPTFEI
ncbi:FeoC-like transcriptional regulator [Pyrococcus sp. ST04]|uniref:FeoC-like transcriptional regulator n=1 Tax=Pyrococcus sp. ST04 TaxID=1183377 RepID=UPI0002605ECD|nr:FeoC-like transcriptional regulator [Pyrococcus sp. ST04]AFK22633.1 hypothetical protein Py04_1058 [Pyrococcus sp. ST04]